MDTAFGQKSVVEMPGYHRPRWLTAPALEVATRRWRSAGETTDALPVTVWSPEGTSAREPLPLLLVQDGPEYDVLARSAGTPARSSPPELPPHRLALPSP